MDFIIKKNLEFVDSWISHDGREGDQEDSIIAMYVPSCSGMSNLVGEDL